MSKPICMHQIRLIIEMRQQDRSIRQTVKLTGLSRNTIREYLRKISNCGLPLAELLALDDESLSAIVYTDPTDKLSAGRTVDERHADLKALLPGYSKQLEKRGVCKQLLWEEYRRDHPEGYGYTRFCAYLNQHLGIDQAVMYFTHKPAEKAQADFAGDKPGYVDRATGEWIACESLVCVLPFSHYMYVEVIRSQKQEDFISGMARFKRFLGGCTLSLKLDNMRTAVVRSNRYEPSFTEAMDYFAAHYGIAVVTARVAKPRDKGSVEKAVDLSYKRIYAPLRNQTFYSLEELNAAIRKQVDLFNQRPFKAKSGSRKQLFEEHEKPLLKPLPVSDYELRYTTQSKVQRNYHVIVGADRHYYSVPYTLIGKRLKIIYTADTIEIYDNLKRVALHKRSYQKYGHTTTMEHRPPNHQAVVEQGAWDDEYVLRLASTIGPSVQEVVNRILKSYIFYEQAYDSCKGIFRLGNKYSNARLENACKRALPASKVNYRMVESILRNNLDKISLDPVQSHIPDHDQIRGANHYL